MEFKNLIEEVKELYDLLLITDKHYKNSKIHGKQLKSILDIIQIKQNDIVNYVLDKNGRQPKKLKTLRGGYNKKILKEEPDKNIDDEASISSEYENIITSLTYDINDDKFSYKTSDKSLVLEIKILNEIYLRIKKLINISPDLFISHINKYVNKTTLYSLNALQIMINMNDKDFIDCFNNELDDFVGENYKIIINSLMEENRRLENNDEDDEDADRKFIH